MQGGKISCYFAVVMYYPDLAFPEEVSQFGKYGRLRRTYLEEHHNGIYNGLLLTGKLTARLNEIDKTSNTRMELLPNQMPQQQGITEELMARDQMA